LRYRYKQCKAREGQKDEIDLVGHRSLLPEAVTQQCDVDIPQKCVLRLDPSQVGHASPSQDDGLFFTVMLSGACAAEKPSPFGEGGPLSVDEDK